TAGSGKLYVAGPLAANGAGTGAGGSIELVSNSASTFVVGAGAAGTANGVITGIIEAKAGSAGDGGEIIIKNLGTGGVSVDLALPNIVTVQPSGNGKGGTFDFQGASLTVNGSLNVDGAGSGEGGTINLAALGPGQLSVNGALSANGGAGNGDGGQISVSYSDGSLTVGCTICSGNYVSGAVTVDAAGGGVPGSITFKNLNTTGNLAVDVNTLVSAHNATAVTYGVINYKTMANQNVIVTVTAPGQLRGAVEASGASVSFATTSLIAGVIAAATGDLTIQSSGGDLTVSGDTLSAANTIKLIAAGLVDVSITSASASSIQLSGATVSFMADTGDLTLDSLSNVTNSLTFHSNQGSVTVPFNLTINGGNIDLLAGTSLTTQQVSASSTTGAGGIVKLKSAAFSDGDITVGSLATGAGVTADGAIDGAGGTIFIEAGDDGLGNSGNVKIYGSVTANGLGLGDGGQIDIKYHVPPPPPAIFQVGGSTEANFVSGSIQVDALGSGQGGQVSITNTGDTELHLNVLTTVSANAATLNDQGTLKFLLGNQPVQLSGNGTLVGVVDVTGSQLVSTIPGLTLRIHDVTVGTAGVNIQNLGGGVVVLNTLTSNGGNIFIDAVGGIQNQGEIKTVAGGDIEFTTPSLLNNGLVDASGTLTIRRDQGVVVTGTGALRAAGGVNLQSALGAVSVTQGEIAGAITGASMRGFNVTTTDSLAAGSVLTIANIAVSGDVLNPTVVSSISLSSATSMAVLDGAQLSAQNNISLLARSGLTIGEDSMAPLGVVITAGTLTPPDPMAPPPQPDDILPAFSVAQPGFVLVDTYQAGAGTGDIVIGDSVTITAHGGTLTPSLVTGADPVKNPGYIGFLSGNDILAADGLTLTSHGGNIWFNALDDIVIGSGLTAISRGKEPDDGDTRHVAGSVIPRYTGGGVAFFAGTIDTTTNKLFDLELVLDKAIGQRSGFNSPRIDGNDGYVLDSNNVLIDKGGLFRVKLPDGITQGADVYTLAGNSFQSIGGVIILDPPADHTVTIQGALLIQTVGPLVVPAGLPPGASPPAPFISIAPEAPLPPKPPANSLVATDTTRLNTNTVMMLEKQKKVQQLAEEQEERETAASGNINSVVRTWFVSMGYCQPFALEQEDGSTVVAAQGTFLSTSGGKKLVLKEGKIVAVAGSEPVSVETAHGTIVVPSGSSAVVEHKASGALRIANLSGSATRMDLKGHEAGLSMSAGEEVVVADTALSEEELIPTDGVDREPVAGAVTIGSVRVNKNKFNRAAMAQRNELLRCDLGAFSVQMKKRMESLRDDMSSKFSFKASYKHDRPGGPSRQQPGENKRNRLVARAVDATDLSPVSYVRPSASAASAPFQTLTTRHATFKYLPGHNMSVDGSGVVHLDAGEALVESHGGTVVQHGPFKVHFKPGTVSLLTGEGELLKVRNLWEDGGSSVRVYVSNRLISASAGQELILTANDRLRRHALINDPVGRRRVKSYDLADGKTVTSCEVSFASLTGGSPLLNSFVRSNREQEQALTSKLIKMAACLNMIHADHGPYSTNQH
ncbi:MAG TPA: hypothetical protein V6D08_10195, partial [Candidatus Obscuribacterales bacterium]